MQDGKGGDAMVVEAGGGGGAPSLPMSSVQPAAMNQTGAANEAQGTQEGEAAPGTWDGGERLSNRSEMGGQRNLRGLLCGAALVSLSAP